MATANTDNQEFPIWVGFKANSHPPVFDLSGVVPFEIYLAIHRDGADDADSRDLVILKAGSVFDLPAALDKGLVELVDEASGEVVRRPQNNTNRTQAQQVATATIDSVSFITLAPDAQSRHRSIQTVQLNAAQCLSELVKPELKYHLRLRDKYLGVRWWAWGDPPEAWNDGSDPPPSEQKRLISSGPLRSKTFTVVSEIPIPPKLSIGLSLVEKPPPAHRTEDHRRPTPSQGAR
ncbi:hypothetical protein O1611_g3768 [Lasiodiplodia mahajangana]|uniref:Uncharacterized protein n=1 Tax=Lasiodiplodia mahajangana TaxID=1108764 RepID=A0ACC2JRP0_9PEZI|nr:hypothetical protein O1611_g3768 [Lasiodiplodia mahajangana]